MAQELNVPQLRAVFESAPGLYLVTTPSLEIVAASADFLRATMTTRADLLGRHLLEMFPDTATSLALGVAGAALFIIHRVHDATELIRLEQQGREQQAFNEVLRIHNERTEIHLRARERDAEETAGRAKDDFLAMLGHELRNPLAAIASATEILKRIGTTTGPAGQSRAVIERQVRHLKRLVDDLLDAARVKAGKVTLNKKVVDLADAVAQAVAMVKGSDDHSIEVDVEPAGINVDPTRLEQILVNLLGNAVKFTPTGRTIRVSVRAERDTAVLTVADEGIGISDEILPRIFDLFFQGDRSAARTEGGLGIGLTLVKALTELHGGSVEARTGGPGRGSTFVVRLPRVILPGAAVARRAQPRLRGQRRVLIIEDNDDAREMLKTWLMIEGHEVLEAANGIDGVKVLLDARPDVAFVDIGLPIMDGYEVARAVRQQPDHPTRLVALTGYGQADDRRKSFEAGFDDFVVKPVDPARLSQILGDRTVPLQF